MEVVERERERVSSRKKLKKEVRQRPKLSRQMAVGLPPPPIVMGCSSSGGPWTAGL